MNNKVMIEFLKLLTTPDLVKLKHDAKGSDIKITSEYIKYIDEELKRRMII